MTATTFPALAQCLCGRCKLHLRAASHQVGACHCTTCRSWGGGPLLAVDCGSDVTLEGEQHIRTYASSDWAERGFCQHCGSHLFYRLRADQRYIVPAGLLDPQAPLHFHEQIFIDAKPDYYAFANATLNLTGAEVFAADGG